MKLIKLNHSMETMVDDEDYIKFNNFKYSLFPHGNNFYAIRGVHDKEFYRLNKKTKTKKFMLHREVMGIEDPKISIDHKDGNGLNNQKANLRICTHSQNMGNRKKNINSSNRFKGVQFHKRDKVYVAAIGFNGKRKHIGNYESEIEAALAYNVAASFAFREFANLNKIEVGQEL